MVSVSLNISGPRTFVTYIKAVWNRVEIFSETGTRCIDFFFFLATYNKTLVGGGGGGGGCFMRENIC